MQLRTPLVLASQSPRRRDLLDHLGLTFVVDPSGAEETAPDGLAPEALVRHLALEKAYAVSRRHPAETLTLGADTVVVLDGQVLGKPADETEARAMLQQLSGTTHTVYTGVALVYPARDQHLTAAEATAVTFAPLSDEEIRAYVASGAPLDKAGAYGIQNDLGMAFVAHLDGDYFNVMGLPVHRLYQLLREHFDDLLVL